MTPRATMLRSRFGLLRFIAAAFLVLAGVVQPSVGSATLGSITTRPGAPTTCDSVGLIVAGTMPSTCYELIGAVLEGPRMLPTMGPLPTFEFLVRMTVQEPNPLLERPCAVLPPYERGFRMGSLPAGRYLVRGVEYLVPYSPDSTAAAIDSSKLDAAFDVSFVSPCPPKGCALLSFGPGDSTRLARCDATAKPGFNACFDVVLMNDVPVGGLQTEITVTGPNNSAEMPGELFHPVSVLVAPHAAGFQVAWSADGSRAKILLFSSTNSSIPVGRGTILHVCYAVAPEVSEGRYTLRYANTVIADPAGGEIPLCPTVAEIVGSICVAMTDGCDLNGDGASDIVDIIQLVRCALAGPGGASDACPDSVRAKADCNSDGLVNIRDVICCVRKVLDGGGFGSGGGAPADTSGTTQIGFTGPVQWISPTEGRATIEITPGTDFAGIQFGIDGSTSRARIRDLSLFDPTGAYHLETSVDPGGGNARAMLYQTMYFRTGPGSGPVPRSSLAAVPPFRIDVILEAASGSTGTGGLELVGPRSASFSARAIATKSIAPTAEVPQSPAAVPSLSVPAPNPFAVGTEIAYTVPTQRRVTLRVYSVSGRLIRTLVDASVPAGLHRARWDGRDSEGREARSGIYFFKFTAGDVERTARVMRLR